MRARAGIRRTLLALRRQTRFYFPPERAGLRPSARAMKVIESDRKTEGRLSGFSFNKGGRLTVILTDLGLSRRRLL